MGEKQKFTLVKECPNKNQSCAVNFSSIEHALNTNGERIDLMEEKQKALVTAFEIRVYCILLFIFLCVTTPASATLLKSIVGLK